MKRIVCLVLVLCFLTGMLWGCGKKEKAPSPSPTVSASASPTPTAAPVKMAKALKVNADGGLNIRSKPSTDGKILGLAENGSMLPLLTEKEEDGWYEVEYEGKSAYVSAEFVKLQDVTLEEYNEIKERMASSVSPTKTDPFPTESPSPEPTSTPSEGGASSQPTAESSSMYSAEDGE